MFAAFVPRTVEEDTQGRCTPLAALATNIPLDKIKIEEKTEMDMENTVMENMEETFPNLDNNNDSWIDSVDTSVAAVAGAGLLALAFAAYFLMPSNSPDQTDTLAEVESEYPWYDPRGWTRAKLVSAIVAILAIFNIIHQRNAPGAWFLNMVGYTNYTQLNKTLVPHLRQLLAEKEKKGTDEKEELTDVSPYRVIGGPCIDISKDCKFVYAKFKDKKVSFCGAQTTAVYTGTGDKRKFVREDTELKIKADEKLDEEEFHFWFKEATPSAKEEFEKMCKSKIEEKVKAEAENSSGPKEFTTFEKEKNDYGVYVRKEFIMKKMSANDIEQFFPNGWFHSAKPKLSIFGLVSFGGIAHEIKEGNTLLISEEKNGNTSYLGQFCHSFLNWDTSAVYDYKVLATDDEVKKATVIVDTKKKDFVNWKAPTG